MNEYIKQALDPLLRKLFSWVQESNRRILWFVASLILVGAFITMFLKWLSFDNVWAIALHLIGWCYSGLHSSQFWLLTVLYATVIILLIELSMRDRNEKVVNVKTNGDAPSDHFIIPPDSSWDYVPDPDKDASLSTVLSVTKSHLTGHLKKGMEWCDYRFRFKAKIIKNNFTFSIRVADREHCLFFQCAEKAIHPHLVMGGIIVRHFSEETDPRLKYRGIELPFSLPLNQWISVSVEVKTYQVGIEIDGVRKEFRIPPFRRYVYLKRITQIMDYSSIQEMHDKIVGERSLIEKKAAEVIELENKIRLLLNEGKNINAAESELTGKRAELEKLQDEFKTNVQLMGYDFERGTIGFRQWGEEHALFKDIRIEVLDKI